jgi:hypothetical protein
MKKKRKWVRSQAEDEVIEEWYVNCKHCGNEILTCDDCGYEFEDGDTVYCGGEDKHVCKDCVKDTPV